MPSGTVSPKVQGSLGNDQPQSVVWTFGFWAARQSCAQQTAQGWPARGAVLPAVPRGVGQAGRFGSIIELGPRWARLLVALAELLVLLSTQLRNKWEGINSHRCPRDVAATAARARAADGRHVGSVEC